MLRYFPLHSLPSGHAELSRVLSAHMFTLYIYVSLHTRHAQRRRTSPRPAIRTLIEMKSVCASIFTQEQYSSDSRVIIQFAYIVSALNLVISNLCKLPVGVCFETVLHKITCIGGCFQKTSSSHKAA